MSDGRRRVAERARRERAQRRRRRRRRGIVQRRRRDVGRRRAARVAVQRERRQRHRRPRRGHAPAAAGQRRAAAGAAAPAAAREAAPASLLGHPIGGGRRRDAAAAAARAAGAAAAADGGQRRRRFAEQLGPPARHPQLAHAAALFDTAAQQVRPFVHRLQGPMNEFLFLKCNPVIKYFASECLANPSFAHLPFKNPARSSFVGQKYVCVRVRCSEWSGRYLFLMPTNHFPRDFKREMAAMCCRPFRAMEALGEMDRGRRFGAVLSSPFCYRPRLVSLFLYVHIQP